MGICSIGDLFLDGTFRRRHRSHIFRFLQVRNHVLEAWDRYGTGMSGGLKWVRVFSYSSSFFFFCLFKCVFQFCFLLFIHVLLFTILEIYGENV